MGKEDEQKEAAQRAKKAGDKAYGIEDYKAAAEHYSYGASLDPSDLSFLMKLANAMFDMKKVRLRQTPQVYPSDLSFLMKLANAMFDMKKEKECLQYCDMLIKEANTRGGTDKGLIKEAELLKEIMRANQASCATDCDPVIAALKQFSSENAKDKLAEAKSMRKMFVIQEWRNQKANKLGDEGLTF